MRTRAFRRFQIEKKKKKVKKFMWWLNKHNYTDKEKEVIIGVRATTPQPCSCMGCGNIPREFGVSRQEINNSLNALDSLEEIPYNRSKVRNLDLNYCDPWQYD